jgi:hypothetical protein
LFVSPAVLGFWDSYTAARVLVESVRLVMDTRKHFIDTQYIITQIQSHMSQIMQYTRLIQIKKPSDP